MEKGENYQNLKQLIDVLNAMKTYLINDDHNFHTSPQMIYCQGCNEISLAVGDYKRFKGRDCLGEHYETIHKEKACKNCNCNIYSWINPTDIYELEQKPEEDIITAISKTFQKMNFPTLYNEELPSIYHRWRNLPKDKKKRQIKGLIDINKKIHETKQKAKTLEQSIAIY
jgi:hypothetical protein